MPAVAVVSPYAEVIVALLHLLTPGREVVTIQASEDILALAEAGELPGAFVVGIFRAHGAVSQAIDDFERDVAGASLLRAVSALQCTNPPPVIIFGFCVHPEELPDDIRYHAFITFPEAIQELNPLLSSLLGPAIRPEGPLTA